MPVSSSTEHWIKQDALTINLNHFGDPDYLQVSILAGTVVMAFRKDVIGYNASHNYRTWPLQAANTYLETSSAVNVYARLTRSEVNALALIVYDTVLRDIEGREISYDENGNELLGESDPSFFYVFVGQISESLDRDGNKKPRAWNRSLVYGTLDSSEQKNYSGLLWEMMFTPHFDNPLNPDELTWIEAKKHLGVSGGVTMFVNNGNLNLPSIYDGLPIDNNTIYWEDVDGSKVLKAKGGGGVAESVSWADITGKPEWLLDGKISYSEIEGTPDLSVYALKRSLSEYVTETELTGKGYATKSDLDSRINALINGAPDAYDTLQEIADVLQGNVNSIGDIITALGGKADKAKTLSGYGITNAYTKTEVNTLLNDNATQTWVKSQGYLTQHQDLSGYQKLITSSNKLAYSLISGTPTALKNPTALKFGTKSYDGSVEQTILASDLGALTSHQTIYTLTFQSGTFASGSFTANSGNKTINIPTTTSHISEGGNLYFTNARAVSALGDTLKSYVTLSGSQTVSGEKNFTGGLKVNGSPIVYDAAKKYWKLEGDLLVTGGVTMYGNDSSFTPSTIMDAIAANLDPNTLAIENGLLTVVGGGSGSISEITKQMVIDALGFTPISSSDVPTALPNPHSLKFGSKLYDGSSSKTILASDLGITWDDILGRPTLLSSFTDDVVAGKYLPLSGGTLSGHLILDHNSRIKMNGLIEFYKADGSFGAFLGTITDANNLTIYDGRLWSEILHTGNYSSYALPLSGGTITGTTHTPLAINTTATSDVGLRFDMSGEFKGWVGYSPNMGVYLYSYSTSSGAHQLGLTDAGVGFLDSYTLIHSGNIGSQIVEGITTHVGDATNANGDIAKLNSYYSSKGFRISRFNGLNGLGTKNSDGLIVNWPLDHSYGQQWYIDDESHTIQTRYVSGGAWSDWKTIAFTDSNVASATRARYIETQMPNSDDWYVDRYRAYTRWGSDNNNILDWRTEGDYPVRVDIAKKLNTARTIWGQSFDGTGDVNGTLTIRGGENTGINFHNTYGTYNVIRFYGVSGENFAAINAFESYESQKNLLNIHATGGISLGAYFNPAMLINSSGNVTIGSSDLAGTSAKLYVDGDIHLGTKKLCSIGAPYNSSNPTLYNRVSIDSNLNGIKYYSGTWTSSTSCISHEFIVGIKNTSALAITNGGNVGIGTTSPAYKLDVNGTIRFASKTIWGQSFNGTGDVDGVMTASSTNNQIIVGSSSYTSGVIRATQMLSPTLTASYGICHLFGKELSNYNTGNIVFNWVGDSNQNNRVSIGLYGADNLLNILGSGNVGIGTISPQYKLHVNGSLNATTIYQNGSSLDSLLGAKLNSSSYTAADVLAKLKTVDGSGSGLDADLLDGKHYSDIINGNVASATKLQTARTIWGQSFDGTGDVNGILTINSGGYIKAKDGYGYDRDVLELSSTNTFYLGYGSAGAGGDTYLHGNNIMFRCDTSRTERMRITSSGNVGIGTTSPSAKLEVNGNVAFGGVATFNDVISINRNGSSGAILNTSKSALKIECYSTYTSFNTYTGGGASTPNVFVLRDNGNIGIGTTSPSQKLHVDGNILTTGGVTMYSMRKLKNIVDERGLSLEELRTIKPTRYTWKDDRDNRIHFGGIADDIQQVLPEVVYNANGVLTMDYGNAGFAIASSLIKPVIDHEQRIKALEKENEELKQEIKRLKA